MNTRRLRATTATDTRTGPLTIITMIIAIRVPGG